MRKIDFIAIHCTGTVFNASVDAIQKYWRTELKWSSPGYHFIIKAGGERVKLLDIELVSNGVQGYNHNSINVAYVGGLVGDNSFIDTRTQQQKKSMLVLLKDLKLIYPKALIWGHRDFPNVHKACPCFDAIPEYKML